MLIPDVNILVAAFRADAPRHEVARIWLETHVSGSEAVGVTSAVLTGFVRIVTHPRIFTVPTPLPQATSQCDALRGAAGVLSVEPGRRHWDIFRELCVAAGAKGNLVADAAHAATAMEAGATWVSFDRDFARFPGLKWISPADNRE